MTHLNKIKALITENIASVEGAEAEQINNSFKNAIEHVKFMIANPGERSFEGFEL